MPCWKNAIMTIARSRLIFFALAIISSAITAGLVMVHRIPKLNKLSLGAAKVILPTSFDARNETFPCRKVRLMNMTFPICIYDAKTDNVVTAYVLRGKYFEDDIVCRCIRLLQHDRRLQLVDIGANVGLWSLPAARVSNVIAVEPNWRSMSRLAKAVNLGSIASNITLINNALSNVRTTLKMGVNVHNQGNTFLINTSKCTKTLTKERCDTLASIKTILLNDLLPLMRSRSAFLKVDVEGHEANVFTDSSAGQFFDHVDVPVVFVEWYLCRSLSSVIVHRLLNFFFSRNYTAFDLKNFELRRGYRSWPFNVLFKKPPYLRF